MKIIKTKFFKWNSNQLLNMQKLLKKKIKLINI